MSKKNVFNGIEFPKNWKIIASKNSEYSTETEGIPIGNLSPMQFTIREEMGRLCRKWRNLSATEKELYNNDFNLYWDKNKWVFEKGEIESIVNQWSNKIKRLKK